MVQLMMSDSSANYQWKWCLVAILISNQLFVSVVANPVPVTCDIPSVKRGDPVKLTCDFGSDLPNRLAEQNAIGILINHWPFSTSADPNEILHCSYTDGTFNCTHGDHVTCDQNHCVSRQSGRYIVYEFVANESSEGNYSCRVLPVNSPDDYQKCSFRLKIANSTNTTVSPALMTSAAGPSTSKATPVTATSASAAASANASAPELQNTSAALSPEGIVAVVLAILLLIVLVTVVVLCKYKETVRQRCPFFKKETRNDDANKEDDEEAHNMVNDRLVEERDDEDVSLKPSEDSDSNNEDAAIVPTKLVRLSDIQTQLSEERDQETDGAQGSDMKNPSGITSGAVGEGDGAERDTRGANRAPNTPSTTKKTTFTASDAQCQNPTQVQNPTKQSPTDLRIPTQAQTPTDLHSPIQAQSPTQAQGLTFQTPTDLQNPTPSQQQRYQNDSAASCSESSAYDCCSKAEKVEFGKPVESWLQAVEDVFCSKNYGRSKSEIEELQRQNNDLLFDLQKHKEFIDARKGEGADRLKPLIRLGKMRSKNLHEELNGVIRSDARNSAADDMIGRYRSQTSLTERHHHDRLDTSIGSEVPIDIHANKEPYKLFKQNAPRASTPSDELDMKKFKVKALPAEDSHVSAVHSNGLENCTMSDSLTADNTNCTADSALNETFPESCNSDVKTEKTCTPASDSSGCLPVVSIDSNHRVQNIQVKGAGIPFTKAVSLALASANDTESKQRKLTEEEVKKEIEQEVENFAAEYETWPAFSELRRNVDNVLQQTEYSDEMFDLLIRCLCNAFETPCIVWRMENGAKAVPVEWLPTREIQYSESPIYFSVLKVTDKVCFLRLRPVSRQL